MNNGKVRIYELSKELNLDNKDILAVCERLNISVKSHSSTITESEAERIRHEAEKEKLTIMSKGGDAVHTPGASASTPPGGQGSTSKAGGPTPPKVDGVAVTTGDGTGPKIGKKQEILEVRSQPKLSGPQGSGGPRGEGEKRNQGANLIARPPKPLSERSGTAEMPTMPDENEGNSATLGTDLSHDNLSKENSEGRTGNRLRSSAPVKPESLPGGSKPIKASQKNDGSGGPRVGPAKLVAPPSRPQTGGDLSAGAIKATVSSVNKPVKRQKNGQTGTTPAPIKPGQSRVSGKSDDNVGTEGSGRSGGPTPRPQIPGPRKDRGGGRNQELPDLQRPQVLRKGGASIPGTGPDWTNTDREDDVIPAVEETAFEDEVPDLVRPTPPHRPAKRPGGVWEDEEEEADRPAKKGPKNKRRKPLSLDDEDDDDFEGGLELEAPIVVSLSLARPAKPKNRQAPAKPAPTIAPPPKQKGASTPSANKNRRQAQEEEVQRPTKLVVTGSLTVQELAEALSVPDTEIVKRLFYRGLAINITETLDLNTIKLVAEDLEVEIETVKKSAQAKKITEMLDAADLEHLVRRPPVVTIMGHVDHGKTTLLDSIRSTKVAQGEAGGITQHIGAYHVDVEHNGETQQVVFLDTPGHEAFTAMRARGARVTDIAILVVAADDGVRPQTIEAISHAKAAQVPIVVAINKIDKPDAQPDRVKQELSEYNLVPEEWGGETIMVPVSAIRGENLDTLLEMILLVAEVEDLAANPNRAARGTVIEAHLDKARGPVSSLLVQNGTLNIGDIVVAGSAVGKVRAMVDDRGNRVESAGPSFAVEVLGLRDVPQAGDEFDVFTSEREAVAIADDRAQVMRESRLMRGRISLSSFADRAKEDELKELNLIVKADVQGSLEAIVSALGQLPQKEVQIRLLLAAPGEVSETDVDLAAASGAVIICFNSTLGNGVRQAADREGVDIREYNIIYKLLDDVQAAMEGLLEPELVEESIGRVEVRLVFPISRGAVAGCYVLSGKVQRNCRVRIRRGNNVVYEGILDSLKRMKDDVKDVNAGYECGISLSSFSDWVEGDIIEAYQMVTKRRTLSA